MIAPVAATINLSSIFILGILIRIVAMPGSIVWPE